MISKYLVDGQEVIELSNRSNKVSVVRTLGGMIYSLTLKNSSILFHDKTDDLTKNDLFRGRILFPYNDRIPEGKYSFNGNTYQFPLNCDGIDSIHGLLYNREMEEISIKDNEKLQELTLKNEIKSSDYSGYPFSIIIEITYKLTQDDFTMVIVVTNSDIKEVPYAIGWHPYFTFGKEIDSAELTFKSKEYYAVDENLYYKGDHYTVEGTEYDFTNGLSLEGRELDIAISLNETDNFVLKDEKETINVKFSNKMFPALQLFIPDDRFSIAVEPISAPSDTFNYPETGLKVLKPNEQHRGFVKVSLSRN